MTKLTKREIEIAECIEMLVMSYLWYPEERKLKGDKWNPQFKKGFLYALEGISKHIASLVHSGRLPSERELGRYVMHYSYIFNPYWLECTNRKCRVISGNHTKRDMMKEKGTICRYCDIGKMMPRKHHCTICDKQASQ